MKKEAIILTVLIGTLFVMGCAKNNNPIEIDGGKTTTEYHSSLDQEEAKTYIEDESSELHYPISNFETGITLKSFGTYVTPSDSPVQPERFQGYHTGVDIEAPQMENSDEIEVYAIANCEVLKVHYVSGYGGVVQMLCPINGKDYTFLYGHLNIDSIVVGEGDQLGGGDLIGYLGEGYSEETDGERQHLHFAVKPGVDLDLSGYVSSESELSKWVNPLTFFNN